MNWKRIIIIVAMQSLAVGGIWLATWGLANWPDTALDDKTTSEMIDTVINSPAGIPISTTVGGALLVLLSFGMIALYLFRVRD